MADYSADDVVRIDNHEGVFPALIVCEHASNYIPNELSKLGLPEHALDTHIAWDPGALGVARILSARLDAPLIHATVSRLVIDLNRDPSAVDSIVTVSEDTPIPGNVGLGDAERERRVRDIYRPFHQTIEEFINRRVAAKSIRAVVSIHSFTPVYRGQKRPWHLGFIHDSDDNLARRVFSDLSGDPSLVVALNEPYNPAHGVYHTLDSHACRHGLAPLMVEIRNDLIGTADGEREMAQRLAPAIEAAVRAL
jgi:predicted N-formylglutamate amidohydrolase